MDSQSPSAGARPITHTTTPPARKLPDIHLDIVLVVFCGGAIGTAIRYAFAHCLKSWLQIIQKVQNRSLQLSFLYGILVVWL